MKRVISIKEAMTPKVLTVGSNTTVANAAKLMADRSVGSVVVMKDKKPVGIITERDLLMKVLSADLKPSKILVSKIMSSPIKSISSGTDITEALKIMAKSKIRRLPVMDHGKLVGIITTSDIIAISPDLMELASQADEIPKKDIEESVCESCGEVTTELYEVNGTWVCGNCRDASTE